MSRCTADLEFLQCDLCHTYFHKDIFCPHRRECKGPGSTELKKGEAELIRRELDRTEDKQLKTTVVGRANLDVMRAKDESVQRTKLANSVEEETDKEVREKLKKHKVDDIMDFLNS